MREKFANYAQRFYRLCAHFLPIMRKLCATILKIMRSELPTISKLEK